MEKNEHINDKDMYTKNCNQLFCSKGQINNNAQGHEIAAMVTTQVGFNSSFTYFILLILIAGQTMKTRSTCTITNIINCTQKAASIGRPQYKAK